MKTTTLVEVNMYCMHTGQLALSEFSTQRWLSLSAMAMQMSQRGQWKKSWPRPRPTRQMPQCGQW